MNNPKTFLIKVDETKNNCPIGDKIALEQKNNKSIPVLSCEGPCIRGEIARITANLLSKTKPYGRACHGELFCVPNSPMAQWVKEAEKIIIIDGCGLKCFGRILNNLVKKDRLIQFNALAHYKKYSDLFDIDSVSETERKKTAHSVTNAILKFMEKEKGVKYEKIN